MINGRISSRSYPRYRLVRPFFRRVLADVDRFCMQSEESARRLIDLGADPAHVTVTGSLKFDSLQLPAATAHGRPRERVLRFFRLSPNRTVIVAGSTMRGEEAAVLGAFARIKSAIAGRAAGAGAAPPGTVRRSRAARARRRLRHDARDPSCRSTPSRAPTSSCSTRSASWRSSISWRTAVFVGGSLADHGGHNILEPAIFGKPIVFGPHMQNFKEIADAFLANDAAIQVQTERELERRRCWRWSPIRCAAPASARRRARWSKPTAAPRPRPSAVIAELLPHGDDGRARPGGRPSFPSGALIADTERRPYGAAAAWRRAWYARDPSRRASARRGRSSASATCASAAAARRRSSSTSRGCCVEQGERPAILTRGYGRRIARDGVTVVSDGTRVHRRARRSRRRAADAGARAARRRRCWSAPTAISPGALAERRLGATVHLLDDGFQHLELARDVDLLLVAEEDLQDRPMPAGRLREGLDAARAADAALITAGYDTGGRADRPRASASRRCFA